VDGAVLLYALKPKFQTTAPALLAPNLGRLVDTGFAPARTGAGALRAPMALLTARVWVK